jgi:hypothetical protein
MFGWNGESLFANKWFRFDYAVVAEPRNSLFSISFLAMFYLSAFFFSVHKIHYAMPFEVKRFFRWGGSLLVSQEKLAAFAEPSTVLRNISFISTFLIIVRIYLFLFFPLVAVWKILSQIIFNLCKKSRARRK